MQPKPDENFDPIERIKQPSSRHCFGCGIDNPHGLGLTFYAVGPDRVECDTVLGDRFQGYPGVVHGGIVATMLDETAGRAIMSDSARAQTGEDIFFVTAKMEVRYRRATPTNTPLVAVGWVEQWGRDRSRVKGELRLSDGTLLAECESLIVRPPPEFLSGWSEEEAHWRVYSDEELDRAGAQR